MTEPTSTANLTVADFCGLVAALVGLCTLVGWIIGASIGNRVKDAMLQIHDKFVTKETCKAIRDDCHRLHEAKFQTKEKH